MKIQIRDWTHIPDGWTIMHRTKEPGNGLRLIKCYRDHLRRKGWVAIAFDAVLPSSYGGTPPSWGVFRGRIVPYSPGPLVLSLTTGAPILPETAHWSERGIRVNVEIHPPVRPESYQGGAETPPQRLMFQAVSRYGEEFWGKYPWEVDALSLEGYLCCPKVGGGADGGGRTKGRVGGKRGLASRVLTRSLASSVLASDCADLMLGPAPHESEKT